MVTTIEEIKQRAAKEYELPGWDDKPFVVKLKKPSIFDLAVKGKIPNELMAVAVELIGGSASKKEKSDDSTTMKHMTEIIDLYCYACMVEPKYDEIKDFMTDEQKLAIYDFAITGVISLNSFREEQQNVIDNINGQGIQLPAEPDTGDR